MKLKVDFLQRGLLTLVLALAISSFSFAQRTISGTITDAANGEPLISATVVVAGTATGTITDFDGKYTMEVPADATQLEVSYTGYATQTVDIGNLSTVDVQLSAGAVLDEIVVTGYGTQKSKEVTGSIASVKAEDFNQGNVNDASQLLQGKVGGLVIARPGSNPNGGFNIRLRGLSTVGASTEPLIVIDGVLGGDLNSVEPQDIASIDVLKDGSASAIYGTRGASGVILITTKRGTAGTSTINVNSQLTLETVARQVDVLTADEYRAFGGGNDRGSSTDWFDELTQTGVSQIHNISMSGGNKGTTYRISGNYRDVQGVARTTGFDRLNFRANLVQKAINDRLTVTANLTTSREDASKGFDAAFRYATIHNPTSPIRDDNNPAYDQWDGYQQEQLFDYFNPVAIIEQNSNIEQTKTLAANVRGDFALTDDLSVGVFYSQQRSNEAEDFYYDKNSFWVGQNRNGLAQKINREEEDQLFRLEANYNTVLPGNTDLRVLAGYEYQDFAFSGFGAQGGDFLTDAFTSNNLSASNDFANGLGGVFSYKNTNKLISFFGRVNLNFDDKFFATASVRRDGSSRFGADEKWGVFPAVSAGVDLVRVAGLTGFDQLKFRAGYGVTGANVGESYLSLQRFEPRGNFFFNGAFVPSFGPASNPNPNLKWETKSDFNVGFDFAFMDYKLTGSLEYYNSTTQDGIFEFNVPVPPNLFPVTFFNVAEVNNSGVELALNYNVDLGGGNSWQIGFSGSRWFTPELVSLTDDERGVSLGGFRDGANLGSPGQNGTPLIRLEEGAPIGQLWGLVVDERNPVNEDGTWNHLDVDGDGTVDDLKDRAVLGNGFPKYNIGLNNSFAIGNLDINAFFRGVLGHDMINTFRAFYEAPGTIAAYNILASSADIPNLTDQPQFSSYHVEDASFLRLDQLTVGYTLKGDKLPTGVTKVRVFFTGQNLFTITGYSGVTPEPRLTDEDFSNFGSLAPGIDRRNTYFEARGFTFGVNLGF
ncbi:MAG: SusC/RagA family TonB-linked outer membrane protein [Bacteroidota bacterium]